MNYSEVIILYGQEVFLVEELKDFLTTLGFSVSTITEKGSGGKIQRSKVKDHILNSRIAIVLATFDSANKNSKYTRPNVVHELTLCLEYKEQGTVVLLEKKAKRVVDLGSNISGSYVSIPFERTGLQKLNTALLKEFISRNWLKHKHDEEDNANTLNNATLPGISEDNSSSDKMSLLLFMNQMDKIWLEDFDEVNKGIPRHDWETEKDFGEMLDLFFTKYWDVFISHVRDKKYGDELKSIISKSLLDSAKLKYNAWKDVAKANHKDLEKYRDANLKNKSVNIKAINNTLDKVQKLFNQVQNKKMSEIDKIAIYKNIINLIRECQRHI